MPPAQFIDRHRAMIKDAALTVLAVADDTSTSLIDVLAAVERYLVEDTKVGDAKKIRIPAGRRGYTLTKGRLVEVKATAARDKRRDSSR